MFNISKKKPKKIHFLHIGKTGGSAIKSALKEHLTTPKYEVILHGHNTSISDLPRNEKFFFFLRHPVTKFISGFIAVNAKGDHATIQSGVRVKKRFLRNSIHQTN